jgi:hypothetical protein
LTTRLSLLAAAVVAAALALPATSALAVGNPNDAECFGHIQRGTAEVLSTSTQVRYVFGCNTPILGYQIQADTAIDSFDTATLAYGGDGQPVATDGFNCNGDFPGVAFNCIGTYGAIVLNNQFEQVRGQFSIDGKLCDEPRVDPLLTVVYATATSAGVVTQYIGGPYDLGRPVGCAKSANSGSARIGPDGTPVSKVVTVHKPAKSHKVKHRVKKARRRH